MKPGMSFWELAMLQTEQLSRQRPLSAEEMRISCLQVKAWSKNTDESLLTDDFAAKLLAYALEFSDYERVWHYKPMLEGLLIAVQKRRFKSGKVTNPEFLALFEKYKGELREKKESCEWLAQISEHYGVDIQDYNQPPLQG